MSPLSLRRYRAERLLRRDFDGLRPTVLRGVRRRLSARGVPIEAIDLDACYAQAWHGLYATVLAGEEIESPAGWLVVVTFRRAIEDARSPALARRLPLDEVDPVAAEPDLADRLDDIARLRHVFEALRTRLSRRECEAASLCYLQGLSRAEAARQMGLSERRMRRLMEGGGQRPGVASKVGDLLAVVGRGLWCEEQSSLMRGLAFGLLDPDGERHALAVAHQRGCPACRAYVASLRGLAATLPPVGLPVGLGAATVAGAGAGAGAGGAAGAGAVGAAGAGGGGWLVAGGSLSGKLAAGCVVALSVGAGCVALTGPGRAAHRPPAAVARRSAPRHRASAPAVVHAVPMAAVTPVAAKARASARGSAAPARAGAGRAARHEFGPEARLARSATAPAVVAAAQRAPVTAAPARAEPRARREFGIG